MTQRIGVAPDLEPQVRAFLEEEKADLETAPPGEGVLQVERGEPKQECGPSTLFAGGRIPCALALETARRLGVTPALMGRFLNLLEIKIHHCQLGCF